MNIFKENDYKAILKHLFRNSKVKGLSRKLAEYLGVHATLVSQVISGEKNFTEEQIFSVCEFLGIPELESEYILMLLKIERAGSKKIRDHYIGKKNEIQNRALQISERIKKDRKLSDAEKAEFYSNWIYSAVHVLTSLEKKSSFEEICKRFALKPAKARSVIEFLVSINMIVEKNGVYELGTGSTHLEKKSPLVITHHMNWRTKALQVAPNLSDGELMYSANVSMSRADFDRFREELAQVVQRFQAIVKDSPAEEIAQLNIDFFFV